MPQAQAVRSWSLLTSNGCHLGTLPPCPVHSLNLPGSVRSTSFLSGWCAACDPRQRGHRCQPPPPLIRWHAMLVTPKREEGRCHRSAGAAHPPNAHDPARPLNLPSMLSSARAQAGNRSAALGQHASRRHPPPPRGSGKFGNVVRRWST